MHYLCLVYQDESLVDAMAEREHAALAEDDCAFRDRLAERGQLISSSILQPVATATTVRVRNDRVFIADGPFVGTQEQLGGYYLIEARDLNEAIRLASKMPIARYGSVEIRPVQDIYLARAGWTSIGSDTSTSNKDGSP